MTIHTNAVRKMNPDPIAPLWGQPSPTARPKFRTQIQTDPLPDAIASHIAERHWGSGLLQRIWLLDCFDMTAGRALVRYQFQHCANARHATDGSRPFAQTGAIVRQVVKFRQIISTHAGRIGRSIRPTIRGNSLRALIWPISRRNQDMPPV